MKKKETPKNKATTYKAAKPGYLGCKSKKLGYALVRI